MRVLVRLTLWLTAGTVSLLADIVTKAEPHPLVVNHYSHTPLIVLVAVSIFLFSLGLLHSNQLAIGAGLMFGGLVGNGGQLLLYGYASDWIPIGDWLTNVADISGAVGLLCCCSGYLVTGVRRRRNVIAAHNRALPSSD